MLATVSNVEGIAKSLNDNGFIAAAGSGATPGPCVGSAPVPVR